jgi:hypothetical protein
MQALVHFVHGKESGPWGSKISRLADVARGNGCDVASLDYSGLPDPQARADHLGLRTASTCTIQPLPMPASAWLCATRPCRVARRCCWHCRRSGTSRPR